jgi:hypothetical protein
MLTDIVSAAVLLPLLVLLGGCAVGLVRSIHQFAPEDEADWLAKAIMRRMLVHTTDDKTIEGNLFAVAPDGVVLVAAQYREGEKPMTLAGHVFIPRAKVAFTQVIQGGPV